jgi:SHS2 domain-containing protein
MPEQAGEATLREGRDYFAHDADIGIVGRGPTIERAFEHAAQAMFEIMCGGEQLHPRVVVHVAFDEPDVELALVSWLNALLSQARTERLVLSRFQLRRDGDHWRGEGRGEPWSAAMERGVEVKGATLTELSVTQAADMWEARCVVDV